MILNEHPRDHAEPAAVPSSRPQGNGVRLLLDTGALLATGQDVVRFAEAVGCDSDWSTSATDKTAFRRRPEKAIFPCLTWQDL